MEECANNRKRIADEFLSFQKVFTALGDEVRQKIIIVLLENEKIGMRVPEITERTHLSRPAVSHHLQILKDAGLIALHRVKTKNYYYISADESRWLELKNFIDQIYDVISCANQNGYPRLKEDEEP